MRAAAGDRGGLLELEAVTLTAFAVLVKFAALFEVVFGVGVAACPVGGVAGLHGPGPLIGQVLDAFG